MKHIPVLLGGAALMLATAAPVFADPSNFYGEPAPASAADRTVVINHDTAYVNVTGGDVVKFVVHGKTYTWNFDTANNISVVDLNSLIPDGSLHHMVKVYVARDPTYEGGA